MLRAVVLFALPFLLACTRQVPPVEINVLWKRNLAYIVPVDLDGPDGGNRIGGPDSAHLWLTFKRHDSLYLQALTGPTALVAVGRDSLPPDGWDGGAHEIVVADIDNDARMEAVVSVVSAMDARPRGIFVLDWLTGKLRWKYETGPPATSLVVRDVDGDGRDELLFGSGAYGNGNVANGTTDESSYVFLLDADGRLRWRTPIGCYSSRVTATWLDDCVPGTPRVLAWEVGSPVRGRTCDRLFILDGRTGTILKRAEFGVFTSCVALAADMSGKPRVLVAGSDNVLRLLDAGLGLLDQVRTTSEVKRVVAARFSHPRARELAVVTDDGRLRVMDHTLTQLGEMRLAVGGGHIGVTAVRFGGRTRLLINETYEGVRSTWSLLDIVPVPLAGRRIPIAWAVIAIAALTLAFAGTLLGLRHRQTRDTRTLVRSLTGQAGVVEIDNRGRVRHTNPKGRELLNAAGATESTPFSGSLAPLGSPTAAGEAARELPLSLASGQTILARATPVKTGLLLTLEDISAVEYLKRISTWVPVAQKLAHDIKNPLTAISLALQRVEKGGPDSERYVESMKDDIDRLKKMADGFMRLTKLEPPKLAPTDINEVVRQCAGKFEDAKPAGVEFKYDMAEDLPPALLDRDQMAVACSNIIENAISAIVGSGAVAIRTSYNVEETKIAVSVSDTGKGIPERYVDKVFEPYFTLKPGGTGLGMALTKRIIEDHKGTIAIESTEGKGTTVIITLPIAAPHV
jgi:signal transduction histidine kinase